MITMTLIHNVMTLEVTLLRNAMTREMRLLRNVMIIEMIMIRNAMTIEVTLLRNVMTIEVNYDDYRDDDVMKMTSQEREVSGVVMIIVMNILKSVMILR